MKCDQCFGNGRSNVPGAYFCIGCRGTGIKPEEKPFDITKHEWSDKNLFSDGSMYQDKLQIVEHDADGMVYLSKLDSIALAKHFKLTAEDLS